VRREELGKVDGVTSVHAQGQEAEDRQDRQQLTVCLRREAGNRRDHEREQVKQDEGSSASQSSADGPKR
jgi:hypothetical protein